MRVQSSQKRPSSDRQHHDTRVQNEKHRDLGNCLILPEHDKLDFEGDHSAKDNPVIFEYGLTLLYGEIGAFSGDCFGLKSLICKGGQERFRKRFESMSKIPLGKDKVEAIIALLRLQSELIEKARENGQLIAKFYEDFPTIWKSRTT